MSKQGVNKVYRALSDPTRRRILALLRERDMTAGELVSHFDLAWPTMSGHFKTLREADLVQADRSGTTITYHLNVSLLEDAMRALMDAFRFASNHPSSTVGGRDS
jgi:DNA-binding transcriptional ArsR family regulator